MISRNRFVSFSLCLFTACMMIMPRANATFFGEVPTGMIELTDFKYPVSLYVPPTYKDSKDYPLLIVIHDPKKKIADSAQEWSSVAKRKGLIVLIPEVQLPHADVPYHVDDWLLNLKKEVMDRYHINTRKVYLIGEGEIAYYAGYLGLRYGSEFNAVAMVGGAWTSGLDSLVRPSGRPRKQVPFYVALSTGDDKLLHSTEEKAYSLTKKGYPVYLEKVSGSEAFSTSDFKSKMLTWMDDKSQRWAQVIKDSEKSKKEKIRMAVDKFFQI